MATILELPQNYDDIRALLSPDVTAEHVPNAYLAQQPFVPQAERRVRKRLSAEGIDISTLTGDLLATARLAVMHETAGWLCLTAPQILRQSLLQLNTEVQQVDWKEKRALHLSEVSELANEIISSMQASGLVNFQKRPVPFAAVGTERRTERTADPVRRVILYNE